MKYSNRLNNETSPYLRQHAHNPVDWYPWGEEALTKAQVEDKPLLVSIGYAACHWCHVMEKESFEDEETAAFMNAHFVNVKIDREERPDLDHIYMDAVQAMTGAGGWPLNVFLTPQRQPFYGGTYFPPRRMYNRPSWKELLIGIQDAYTHKKEDILTQAAQLTDHLRNANRVGRSGDGTTEEVDPEVLDYPGLCEAMYTQIMAAADRQYGGFGQAPKFPGTLVIQYLLRYDQISVQSDALQQAVLSVDRMAMGGIYDQLGGGLARYATDERWLVPHFEKMLYDNALFAETLAEAYQVTGNPVYAEKLEQTLNFIASEMTSPDGAFYASLDADSEGEEGKYYVWDFQEVRQILGPVYALFCAYYDIREEGNWEGKNILWETASGVDFARTAGITERELQEQLQSGRQKLLAARQKRVRPQRDDKILLGWNALMCHAYGKASVALGRSDWRDIALNNLAFLRERLYDGQGGHLFHVFKEGRAHPPAFLDDYAYYIRALLNAQEITADQGFLEEASAWTAYVIEHFSDEENLFFYYTPLGQPDVIIRKKEIYDGATPSGNAVMATLLMKLSILLDKPAYRKRSEAMVDHMAGTVARYPTSFGMWGLAMWDLGQGIGEIAVMGKGYTDALFRLLRSYIPGHVIMASAKSDDRYPMLRQRPEEEEISLYLCRDYTCLKPFHTVDELVATIRKERRKESLEKARDPVEILSRPRNN